MSIVTNDSFLQWDPAQVSNFIDSINDAEDIKPGNYFLENNIEGSLLPFITTEHLKEIGIEKLSSRLVIKKKISELINQHLEKNPPKSFNDPQYKLNNININNNYISIESLNFSTVLMKDMIKKVTISLRHHQSQTSSPIENQQLDMKKLNDNFIRLKSDLIPVIRLLKDSKPLPTPTLDPGYGSNIGNLDSPTYSISSAHSSNSNTLFDTIQDAVQSTSNRNSNPLPSPTQSNRFSSGSLLSLGTGKIIQSNNGSATMLNNNIIHNGESNPVDPNSFNANTMSGNGNTLTNNSTLTNNKSRPRLVESKSTGATSTFNANNPISAPKTYRKHSSSTSSTVGSLPSSTPQPQPASVNPGGFTNAEPLKQLRASTEDSCLKILQQAMKRHHVPRDDWSKYVLVICYGDKERILKLAEKPVPIFKELQELGKHPAIMLRQLAETKTNIDNDSNELYEDSRIGDEIPGGTL